ncbi:hypothetical protein OHS59_42505 [Streptomyces sp. NBC_00414]|uniref:hypothetical protein n=1 Tax=Streptomyces sp. NBC_00414 TaxID=2975739 RepID=UPI002E1A284B
MVPPPTWESAISPARRLPTDGFAEVLAADPGVASAVGTVVGDPDADWDGDAVGASEDGAADAEADDALREGDVSSFPPASAVPVIAATSAPEVSRTSDVRFMANLL